MRALPATDRAAWMPSAARGALQAPVLLHRRRRLRAAAATAGENDGSSAAAARADERSVYVWPTSPSWLKGPKSPYRGAVAGGSGSASFGLGSAGAGKAGVAAFVGSPWQGPAAAPPVRLGVAGVAAAAPPATSPAADTAAAGQGSLWNLASLQQRLQSLGLAGVMAYGLFNTLYYTATFAFFWLVVAKVPRGLGLAVTAQKFLTVMAAVWAGSQVTKVPRAAAALVLAPLVDRLMAWLQRVGKLESRRQVFGFFVAGCLGLAFTLFSVVVLTDLPANVRPIIEDNKMLQEELRRYRQQLGEQEGTIATQDRTITALRDELQRQRTQLRECSAVSPAQLLQEQQFRRELRERDETVHQLRQKAEVLERAKAAAERRLANDLAAERRAAAALKQQMKAMQEEMAEKSKQHRFNQLHIKDLYQRLEPLEAAVAAAAQAAQQAPPPVPAPPPEPQVVCQLMLCMVYQQPQPSAAEVAEAAARLAMQEAERRAAEQRRQHAAATRLQAAARGYLARRRLAAQHAAATTIQAAARGFLVRQALATIWEAADEEAEEAAQSAAAAANLSPAQRLAQRQREAELHYQRRAAAGKAKPQKRLPARPGSTARGANTAVEAAARRRGLLPAGGEVEHGSGAAAARRASALALLGGSGQASSGSGSGSSSSFRRLSSLAGLGSRTLGQGPDGFLPGAGTGGPGRTDAFAPQGHVASRASWTGKAARATTSSAEGRTGGTPSGSPVRGGRQSMARVPRLDLAQQDVQKRLPAQQQPAQDGRQQGDRQRQQRSQVHSEEGGQQEHIPSGSPSWQLERPGPPAEPLVPGSGGQRSRRRESLGFGSTKPRV
ncbi:TY4B-J: Transposon Ty4-J Gag-Pol poly [Chlorella sorokiniana]|uniref:TY4B-J: Transposon Ty4-J Gag-Pol poly n=1 Tax=Chlorella sorokiniana TaxID=3076 RepID=A0A2P6U140_CHLSO|nr:TY4B-J: Transposon Ty4-J Gag-Pol poly [Chlorella sorokiniana]|eukprot:PRW60029.1 TY4B-J: Transposon Ty4-J Gag-Pol poly [Chlorella sorokiniana]